MTETRTLTLSEFLLARIAEDEAVTREAYGVRWEVIEGVNASQVLVHRAEIRDDKWRVGHLGHVATVERGHDVDHIARWDPARVLAECQAKLRIVERLTELARAEGDETYGAASVALTDTLRLLALPYADHPDYQPEWRP
jgi:hypothetical protein